MLTAFDLVDDFVLQNYLQVFQNNFYFKIYLSATVYLLYAFKKRDVRPSFFIVQKFGTCRAC